MPLIAQICMVLVTIALAVMAIMAIRLMAQIKVLIQNANISLAALPELIEDAKRTSARADELLVAFSQITRSAKASVSGIEAVATRTSDLASSLLDEAERPISTVVRAIRGIRFGANFLAQRWKSRANTTNHTTQGDDNVREQQWIDDGGVSGRSSGRRWSGTDLRPDGR